MHNVDNSLPMCGRNVHNVDNSFPSFGRNLLKRDYNPATERPVAQGAHLSTPGNVRNVNVRNPITLGYTGARITLGITALPRGNRRGMSNNTATESTRAQGKRES